MQKNHPYQYLHLPMPMEAIEQFQCQIPRTKLPPNKNQHQKEIVLLQKVQNHIRKLLFFPNPIVVVLLYKKQIE